MAKDNGRNPVDIACEIKQDNPDKKAIAIADGTEEQFTDNRTGETRTRLKWFWLPRSQTEINGDGTVTIPEWLAVKQGLV